MYIWLVIQRIGIWETCDSTIPILPIHFVTKDIGYINPICPDHALFLSSWKRALGLFGGFPMAGSMCARYSLNTYCIHGRRGLFFSFGF